jgi:hypothetical protein
MIAVAIEAVPSSFKRLGAFDIEFSFVLTTIGWREDRQGARKK